MSTPNDRQYSAAHVWVMAQDGHLLMGITEHAQESLGGIEHLELPPINEQICTNLPCGNIESVKTVSDLIAPLNARVSGHNQEAIQDPMLVNDDPYGEGWLIRLEEFNEEVYRSLLDAKAYEALFD